MPRHYVFALLVIVGAAGCVADPNLDSGDESADPGGKADDLGATDSVYKFTGRFHLFHGIISQIGELSGSFEMAPPMRPYLETNVRNVQYTLALEADQFHRAYTLRSAQAPDRSYAEWRATGLQIFIEQQSPLTAGADQSVIDAGDGGVLFKFFPFCKADLVDCQPGALSGFDFEGSGGVVPAMRLHPVGPFELTLVRAKQ